MARDRDWALRAVQSVGNYGEMFERNLGRQSPLKLERGLNRLWTQGGLMYAPPMRLSGRSLMSELQIYITLAVFAAVILAIAFDVIDMAVAALLGVSVLIGLGHPAPRATSSRR